MADMQIRDFRKSLRRFERLNQITNTTCCEGITLAQCHVLLEMEELGRTTTKQLAENLRLDKSTLSRTIDGLKRLGMVKRSENKGDRRFTILELTQKGKAKCDSLNEYNDELYRDIFKDFKRKDKDLFLNLFEELVEAFSVQYNKQNACNRS